ncbi:MAG: hypothetical protein PHV11_08545 [Candidatus Bipolaricaulis sp.]|jgi:hypothetical protein|nr:hypothetical protein [Candidatus Bipolaricaulis sp.]
MTKQELAKEIHLIGSCFPKFRPPETWKEVIDAYYEHLQGFPLEAIRQARILIVQDKDRGKWGTAAERASDFPTAAELFDLCRVYMQTCKSNEEARYQFSRFHPTKHQCHPQIKGHKSGKANSTRLMLFKANPYEGFHVLCQGQPAPVCPMCGAVQEPWVNPFIKMLMEMHPKETKGWNPYHKGLLLCYSCSESS